MPIHGERIQKLSEYLGHTTTGIAVLLNKLYDCNPTDRTPTSGTPITSNGFNAWGPIEYNGTKITSETPFSSDHRIAQYTGATIDQIDAFFTGGHCADFVQSDGSETRLTVARLETLIGDSKPAKTTRIAGLRTWLEWVIDALPYFNFIYIDKAGGGTNLAMLRSDDTLEKHDVEIYNGTAREVAWDAMKVNSTTTGRAPDDEGNSPHGAIYEFDYEVSAWVSGYQSLSALLNFVSGTCTVSRIESHISYQIEAGDYAMAPVTTNVIMHIRGEYDGGSAGGGAYNDPTFHNVSIASGTAATGDLVDTIDIVPGDAGAMPGVGERFRAKVDVGFKLTSPDTYTLPTNVPWGQPLVTDDTNLAATMACRKLWLEIL